MKIIVGLGNPGKKYEQTPHNIGFAVIDVLAAEMSCSLRRSLRFQAHTGKAVYNGDRILLVKPQTYMNNSGKAVGALMRYQKADPSDVIVVSDDADLDLGCLRIRSGGGSGGHRGIDSLIGHLGTNDFVRVRVGVGKGREGQDLEKYVLQRFGADDLGVAEKMAETAAKAVKSLQDFGIEETMNKYNGRQDIE